MTVRPRVFVTGGSGAIGSHAVPELVRAGSDAVALVRTPAKAAQIAAHGATPALVSLFDRNALAVAFAGCDAVVNLASALPSTARFMSRRAWAHNNPGVGGHALSGRGRRLGRRGHADRQLSERVGNHAA